MKYVKNGFHLGQQLTLDGLEIIITGFYIDDVQYCYIITTIYKQDELGIFLASDRDLINYQTLQKLYESYVDGLGAGTLNAKDYDKEYKFKITSDEEQRLYSNWKSGYDQGYENIQNKTRKCINTKQQ